MSQEQEPPELHLEFGEEAFGAFWNRLRKSRRCRYAEYAAHFVEMSSSLSAVAQAFAARHVVVQCAEASGGFQEHVILLPRWIALSAEPSSNREFLFARAALAGAMVQSGLPDSKARTELAFRDDVLDSELAYLEHAVRTAAQLSHQHAGFRERIRQSALIELGTRPSLSGFRGRTQTLERMRQEALSAVLVDAWPGFTDAVFAGSKRPQRRGATSAPVLLFGGPLIASELAAAEEALAASKEALGISSDATEVVAPVKDHVKRILLEAEDDYKDATPDHAFEKVMFAEKNEGGRRRLDGEDDMDDQQQSLDAVDLRELIRGGPEVHSIYQAEIGDTEGIPNVESKTPGEFGVTYDEWDEKAQGYRKDWVTVYHTPVRGTDREVAEELQSRLARTVRTCMRRLERQRTERRSLGRQSDGDELDLCAVVEDHTALRSGLTPTGRVYIHTPRLERDLATTVLLDLSLSADSWIEGRRVLDAERDAAFVLGEVAERMGDDLQILAYATNTRNLCRIWEVKRWKDSWHAGSARLGLLKPQGYTRIGPAVRHAYSQLQKHPARHKHLILVTDAKPTDIDHYEGSYGVHDVRRAVREAAAGGVRVHAMGIDPKCAGILPVMFGVGGWRVLPHLADLPEALVAAYGGYC